MKKNFFLILLIVPFAASGQRADILVKNGRIADGTGNSWFYGDIAIKKDKIFAIGNLGGMKAKTVIDAGKKVIAPGFIDVHTHIEGDEKVTPTADNFIYDGVTTVITGNCGGSEVDIRRYFQMLDSIHLSVNTATFIGHNDVRRAVMGTENREPTAPELRKMEALVEKAMRDGAVGLSTGLIYIPGTYAKTGEVVALAKTASRYHGIYTSHIRSESQEVFAAIDEALNIGRQANMPVQISHFKIGKPWWGRSDSTLGMIIKARNEGFDVTIDQYPYTASSTSLNSIIPSWALENGREEIRKRLNDSQTRQLIAAEMLEDMVKRQRPDFSYAVVAYFEADPALNGKNISEINVLQGRKKTIPDEIETILGLVARGGASMVFHSMDEADVQNIMKYPFTMIASDSGIRQFGKGVPHPRGYGSNARVLSKYVREKNTIGLEDAIRRMTSLPAQKFGFTDRGLLRKGMKADLVIFDPAAVNDESTYEKPHAFSKGFQYVLVNGKVTVDNFIHTQVRNGRVLYGPGHHN
ncbi:N-acyl-D-amino-acid deacylase family protein [Hufsiella ginkgonis]|uniref:Amidohydrolase family protein n=1 Tax=Hufsiella ginkgonis TaxID=2695274 RepID=A0A7K1Y4G5_9SPHI|nr:D-aminoacylase [Hufsiella ginkgonis]MXV17959.1 amidohydrolase family protein [Hufsiella ginkgonis]